MHKTIKIGIFLFFLLQINTLYGIDSIPPKNNLSLDIPETETYDLLLEKRYAFIPERNHQLSLNINSSAFTRNAEYFLPYTKGYTLLGFYLQPTLIYQINDKALIQAGVHLMGIAGTDGLRKVSPIMRIEYQATQWLRVVGGTLYGNLNHKLYEPMYSFDRYFYANVENGIQLLTDTRHWKADLWCNWENFLEPEEYEQEKFTIGLQNRFYLSKPENKIELSIPLHLLGTHRGGQFSALQDTCIETLVNGAIGFTSTLKLNKTNLIRKITLDIPIFGFLNNSNHVHTHFKDGWSVYPHFTLQNKKWKLQAGYWYADRYVAPRGSYLFQSIAYFDNSFEQAKRNMITGKIFFEHHYKELGIGFEGQAYYDTDHQKTDFSFGIYLRFDKDFRLLKIKQ